MNYTIKTGRIYVLFVLLILYITDSNAQKTSTVEPSPEVMAWTVSTLEPWPPGKYKSVLEAMVDNKIFPPFVFRGGLFQTIDYKFSRDSLLLNHSLFKYPSVYKGNLVSKRFKRYLFLKMCDDGVYKKLLEYPDYFKYSSRQLPGTTIKPESISRANVPVNIDVKTNVTPRENVNPSLKFIPDRKYWISTFAADIKFSQNKSSDNWYGGKINNMNIFTNSITTYNYARNKLTLTNTLSTLFTVTNVQNDTLRRYTVGNDELRFRSNFGLRAIKNWNYSASGEFVTAMGNKYIPNTDKKHAAFLSPFTINAGMGMTYGLVPKFKKPGRALNLSLSIEPLALKYMFSKDTLINLPAYFPKGENGYFKHELRTLGSTIAMNQTTTFNKFVSLYTRLNYFTNYERVIADLENKLTIILNRYFSTTLHVYLRYDDGVVKPEGSKSYVQSNEIFSFGFSYRW